MKRCQVCGRSIKTGYKYCYEHRHTKAENYGLPSDRMRRQYHAQPAIALSIIGFVLIIISLFAFSFSIKWGLILLGLGILCVWMGLKEGGQVERRVVRDKLEAKRNREELYNEVREDVYHKHHKPNLATRASDSLGNSLTNIFRAMQKR